MALFGFSDFRCVMPFALEQVVWLSFLLFHLHIALVLLKYKLRRRPVNQNKHTNIAQQAVKCVQAPCDVLNVTPNLGDEKLRKLINWAVKCHSR